MECNHPYLEVLEIATIVPCFFGTKEKGIFIIRQIQGLFVFLLKEKNFRAL